MRRIAGSWVLVAMVGCSGFRFGSASLNESLPEDWKNRNFYLHTALFKRNLAELAGSVLYKSPEDQDFRRMGRILKPGYTPTLEVVDDGMVYESKVDRGAALQGSYLAWTASLGEKEKASVFIQDVSQVFIGFNDVPWGELAKLAAPAKPDPKVRRYYVQGALLSTVVRSRYMEVEANASGVVSEAFGVGGNIYARQGQISRDFRIALELIDLDAVQSQVNSDAEKIAVLKEKPELWEELCLKKDASAYREAVASFRCEGLYIESIRDADK